MTTRLATWERVATKQLLNLAVGQPALSLLPTALLQSAAERTIGAPGAATGVDPRYLLQYGGGAGNGRYLTQLAGYLSEQLGHPVAPENVFASTGNSSAIALVSGALSSPGDALLMEDPSYFLAHSIFRDHGLVLRAVPHAASTGTLDLGAVEALLADTSAPRAKLLYLVPTANNPTGRTMGDADRARLVQLCAQHGVTILSDDVYELLSWTPRAQRPRPLRWHARQHGAAATVVSLGSWSKLLGPGLRLGWVEAEPELIERLCRVGAVTSGGGAARADGPPPAISRGARRSPTISASRSGAAAHADGRRPSALARRRPPLPSTPLAPVATQGGGGSMGCEGPRRGGWKRRAVGHRRGGRRQVLGGG